MKKLIKRFSRVADSSSASSSSSSQYCLLRSDPRSPTCAHRPESTFRNGKIRRSRLRSGSVPEGHVPVYVGEEMEKFVVRAQVLNHPIFVKLLNESAQEYGYEQKGVLRIPCRVLMFERVLEALRVGDDSVHDLVGSFSDDFF